MNFVKSSLLCIGVLLMSLAFTNVSQAVDMAELVAVWTLDEGSGDTVMDSSGNGNDGAIANGDPEWVDGKFGSAMRFDGEDDWVAMNAPVVVDTVDFTMGCWVNPGDTQKTWANILSSHVEPPRRGISFEQTADNVNLFGIAIGDGENWAGGGTVQLVEGEWNHMAFVRSGATGYWYYNGAPDDFNPEVALASDLPVVAATHNFQIGAWPPAGADRAFNGTVDDAFIFERALSAEDIAQIAEMGISAALSGGTAVDPRDKVSVTWGAIKASK